MMLERNKYGLYDSPVRTMEKEYVSISRQNMEAQLEAGAFMMTHEKAIKEGFLYPHDEQDTVIACVQEDV